MTLPSVRFAPVVPEDFDALCALRLEAMRPSLQRIGRFDPERSAARFRESFSPEHTLHILWEEQRVGFFAVKPRPAGLLLDHLYLSAAAQGRGIGAHVLAHVFELADAAEQRVSVGALRDSDANRFYQRHGFELVGRTELDNYYVRHPRPLIRTTPSGTAR